MQAKFKPEILIVDDVENNIFTLRTLIEAHFDANLIEATSGEQVLRIINERSVDLILMDVMMPGMDGFETARLIKNRPKTSNIPIIFISAYDPTQKLLEKGIAAGGFDYLTKPIDDNQLVYRLKMYLRFIQHEFLMNLHLRELNLKLIEEIEERKTAEQTLQISQKELKSANASKDKFFSIIAHDLKNPFNAIIGLATLLTEDYDSFSEEEHKEFLMNIKSSAENTFRLLQNLLDWSQTQTGKILFEPTQFFLNTITSEIYDLVKPSADNKNIRMEMNIPSSLQVFADKNMINTVIRNLLLNAIKFTRKGGFVKILAIKSGDEVEIGVVDNGVGISPEKLAKLFLIDANIASNGTAGEEGTGLGLILCKEFIEKNEGKIRVESQECVGTNFTFTLPAFYKSN
ncbi:MAG: hybrid sensor histidine kinase/response regulator [Bacteroidetes bacterium]|nr:hybrid sensor histidine kinase/response regulator [Bacteroidota bacterium]